MNILKFIDCLDAQERQQLIRALCVEPEKKQDLTVYLRDWTEKAHRLDRVMSTHLYNVLTEAMDDGYNIQANMMVKDVKESTFRRLHGAGVKAWLEFAELRDM